MDIDGSGDGRLVRGEVNTLYDPSESGLTNLDDIFTGGGTTGKVVEGITKTDLRADFVITESSDFFFDETQNEIEVHDENGQVIGYIETGNVLSESKSPEGGTGNEPSVFPMTLEDKEGNLYQVEEIPGAGGSDDLPEDSDGVRKKLSVKPLGKAGGALRGDEVNFKRLDREVAEVVFSDVDGSVYAFDGWESCYDKSYLIRDKYEQLGQDYYVPSKLLPSGKSDKVLAILKISAGSSVTPDRVVFKTSSGTEYRPDSYDAKTRRWVLSLVGGQENDGQELYALYPKPGGGYYNLGKLLIVSYPSYRLPVKIVPVGKDFLEYDLLERRLREIYARVGIECLVEKLPVFAYDSPLFFKDQSGLLSAYNSEMKSLNSAYASSHVVEEDASYLFILSQSGHKRDRNFSGFMPLGKQYGYLFRDDFKNFDAFSVAAAHELAHGRLSLRHPFDKSLGLSEGDVPDNLMDYRNGTHLAKWQWDVIHDPGVVVRIFERDKDAMKRVDLKIDRGDYNIGGHEDILFYLLSYKEDELVYNLQKYDYVAINSDEEKNKVAVLVIKNVLSGIEIGDEIEARILVEEFINNYSIRKIALLHEQIMEKIQNSETFPEIDIRNMINDAVLYTSIGTSLVDNFVKSYKEFWMSFKLINLFDIEEFRRYFLYDKSIVLSKQGISNLLQFVSNGKFKDIIRSKLPAITNNELRDMIKLKNNFSLQSSEKFTNIIKIWKPKDAEKIFYELDDLTLALLVGQESNFEVLNNTTSKNIWMKFSKLSENGTFEKIGATIGFISLLRKIEEDKMLAPADIVSVFPNTVSLFSFLIEWVVDDKLEEIGSFIFDEAPDWSMVKKWNVNFRGQLGFPDEPLYMYYTDEKGKVNPDKIPTSFIMTREIALKVFNFLPIVVDFDNKGTINFDQNKPYFLPTKQVYLR